MTSMTSMNKKLLIQGIVMMMPLILILSWYVKIIFSWEDIVDAILTVLVAVSATFGFFKILDAFHE